MPYRIHRDDPHDLPTAEWIAEMQARFPVDPYQDKAMVRKLSIRGEPRYQALTLKSAKIQLERFFGRELRGPFTVSDLQLLSGGASKEQYSFRLQWSDNGDRRNERMVLRVQPAQSSVETSRLREFQVLDAIQGQIPAPKPYWVDNDAEIFQQPALIYSFCEGVARPPATDGPQSARGGYGPKWRHILTPQFIDYMAKIATFDYTAHNFSAFEVPAVGTTEGVVRALNLSQRAWEEDRLEAVPLMTLAARWLRDNAPPIDQVSLVHGDYRAGNFLFSPESGKITAILDWECVRFGDRHEDLATVFLPALADYDEDGTSLIGGFCPREEFIARYEDASGLTVDLERLAYYEFYTCWRTVCICLASGTRCVVGQKTHQDIVLVFNTLIGGMSLGDLAEALQRRLYRGS